MSGENQMKIGIITHYYNSINYGGVLQAYALCRFLNDRGHTACQIAYAPTNRSLRDKPLSASEFMHKVDSHIAKRVFRQRNRRIKAQMQASFQEFRQNIPHTECVYTKETIRNAAEQFDMLITGSDQVWNPNWFDSSFLLDFSGTPEKKLAYAASMGVTTLSEKQGDAFRGDLLGFKAISTRERAAARALEAVTDRPVEVCVDPTLLLEAPQWDELASERIVPEGYVFLYLLGGSEGVRRSAEAFARTTGRRLVMIPDLMGAYRPGDRRVDAERITTATPQDFLSLVKHADYVLTDSFHACVFSLLFHREFFAFERGGGTSMSSRIRELLEMFECPERFLAAGGRNALSQPQALAAARPTDAYPLFEILRQRSIDFLERNLER